jgi:hypothetical protein
MAEFQINQVYKTTSTTNGTKQTINCYEYQPINIILTGLLDTTALWDDYRDRTLRDLEIKVWKSDMTNYISSIFDNCHVKTIGKTGKKYEGLYEAKMIILAEDISCTANFLNENPDNFSNHFKAGI